MYWDLVVVRESGLESFPPFGREFAIARSFGMDIVLMIASLSSA
jgi:hypothetical protein